MNKLVEVTGALDALNVIKTAGFALLAEPKVYSMNSGEWPEFAGYAPLTAATLTERLSDNGIDAVVEVTDKSVTINVPNPDGLPCGELVGVLRPGSVDYV